MPSVLNATPLGWLAWADTENEPTNVANVDDLILNNEWKIYKIKNGVKEEYSTGVLEECSSFRYADREWSRVTGFEINKEDIVFSVNVRKERQYNDNSTKVRRMKGKSNNHIISINKSNKEVKQEKVELWGCDRHIQVYKREDDKINLVCSKGEDIGIIENSTINMYENIHGNAILHEKEDLKYVSYVTRDDEFILVSSRNDLDESFVKKLRKDNLDGKEDYFSKFGISPLDTYTDLNKTESSNFFTQISCNSA